MALARRIVVKLGTSTLTAGTPRLNPRRMLQLAQQMVRLREVGSEVVVVSSGAMAAGRERLGIAPGARPKRPIQPIPYKQMLAAVGQAHLMLAWEQVFEMFEVQVAQVLLTRDDLQDRRRYLNARNTLDAILVSGILPIVNENDAIATEEIRIGDNDNLSALVANVLNADLLVILSDIDGLFTADPRKDALARLVDEVDAIDDKLRASAGGSKTSLGVGGMLTKLQAAELAMRSGTATVLANGAREDVLWLAANGERVGTRFRPSMDPLESRKRWIVSERAAGSVEVDAGAARALRSGRSLLAVGVRGVSGDFNGGDVIAVRDAGAATDLARGIARYGAQDARRIAGRKTEEVRQLLGPDADATLIHADDLVVL